MPHYKDTENNLHFLDDDSFSHLLPAGSVKISVAEATASLLPTLYETKAAKLSEINAECDKRIASIRSTYPETEVLSWYRQEKEARELLANPAAVTPLVDGIAEMRGQTREELADLVIAKADRFAALTAPIIGTRQVLEKRIEAAATIEQVDEVKWD